MASSFGVSRTLTMLRVPPYTGSQLAASFNPNQISGLVAALYGTNLVGADGAALSSWPDPDASSGFVQATGGNQPVKKTGILNGLPVARFTRASSTNFATPAILSTSSTWSIFLVFKLAEVLNTEVIFNNGNTASSGYGVFSSTEPNIYAIQGGAATSPQVCPSDTTWKIVGVMRRGDGTFHARATGNGFFNSTLTAPNSPVGATSIGGDVGSNNHYIDADVFALLWYNQAIDASGTSNFDKVYGYLSNLTGLS